MTAPCSYERHRLAGRDWRLPGCPTRCGVCQPPAPGLEVELVVSIDTADTTGGLAEREARRLTDEVKADAAALWAKLLRLYEGGAHLALGYSSWGAYYEAEFGARPKTGYRLLEAARVADALSDTHVTPSQNAARELAPVLRAEPGQVEEVWGEVVAEHGPAPTAKQVREVVQDRRPSKPPPQPVSGEHDDLCVGHGRAKVVCKQCGPICKLCGEPADRGRR